MERLCRWSLAKASLLAVFVGKSISDMVLCLFLSMPRIRLARVCAPVDVSRDHSVRLSRAFLEDPETSF